MGSVDPTRQRREEREKELSGPGPARKGRDLQTLLILTGTKGLTLACGPDQDYVGLGFLFLFLVFLLFFYLA